MNHPHPFHYDMPSAADSGDELSIQARLRRRLKDASIRTAAVPNAARRTAWEAMKAKSEGLSAGFPDLIVIAEPGLVAFMEIKAKGGSLKPEQTAWLNFLYAAGFPCGVFRSVDTALAFLGDHGFPVAQRAAA